MRTFELRETETGYVLSGGGLPAPLTYPEKEYAIRLVGFMSQKEGSELRIYGKDGGLIDTEHRKATMSASQGSLESGLRGETDLGNNPS